MEEEIKVKRRENKTKATMSIYKHSKMLKIGKLQRY
jgi:hypothetical protein